MKKIILSLALLFVINSAAMGAHQLSDFPLGMTQQEAVARGLAMQDQYGGLVNIMFGGREWPAALVFENQRLVYVLLRQSGEDFITGARGGLFGQLGWLAIYAVTDRNLEFDAVALASSGMSEEAIEREHERFRETMQIQNIRNFTSVHVSMRVWAALRQLREGTPAETFPDAVLSHLTVNENEVTLMFTTFGYMDRMNRRM